ncbi:hypothetical protein JHW43_008797 [Diplocarpon mali]|nr:hypothetical protein JHW43_008797 [Diplocarpon mali]
MVSGPTSMTSPRRTTQDAYYRFFCETLYPITTLSIQLPIALFLLQVCVKHCIEYCDPREGDQGFRTNSAAFLDADLAHSVVELSTKVSVGASMSLGLLHATCHRDSPPYFTSHAHLAWPTTEPGRASALVAAQRQHSPTLVIPLLLQPPEPPGPSPPWPESTAGTPARAQRRAWTSTRRRPRGRASPSQAPSKGGRDVASRSPGRIAISSSTSGISYRKRAFQKPPGQQVGRHHGSWMGARALSGRGGRAVGTGVWWSPGKVWLGHLLIRRG